MKKFMGNIKRRGNSPDGASVAPQGNSPEAIVVREVTAFCESGAPDSQNAGDEYLHLPTIVDTAESSPAAAREAALCIRRYLSKDNYQRGFAQYNAIMLTRILTDNPAKIFTQNFDGKFVSTTKDLLRDGKDASVQQILRETLDYFEAEKLPTNETLSPLVEMWRKEKGKTARLSNSQPLGPRTMRAPPFNQHQSSNPGGRSRGLPAPDELAARIEESKTTARLLLQTIQSTPTNELLNNDLVKEFADRAQSAHRSIQAYMRSENPHPDEDTMLTLIETNDQLNIAMSKHQRAVLQARKNLGMGTPSPQPQIQPGQNIYFNQPPPTTQNAYVAPSLPPPQSMYNAPPSPPRRTEEYQPPSGPPPGARGAIKTQDYAYSNPVPPIPARRTMSPPVPAVTQPAVTQTAEYGVEENPFSDEAAQPPPTQKKYSLFDKPVRNGSSEAVPQRQQPTYDYDDMYGDDKPYEPPSRPTGPYGSTPSYMNRQDSALNNLTMHGGSPPVPERGPSPDPRSSYGHSDQDEKPLQQRMGNLQI